MRKSETFPLVSETGGRRTLLFGASLFLFATIAGVSGYLTIDFFVSRGVTSVPSLIGMSPEEAEKRLKPIGVRLVAKGAQHSSSAPKDEIIRQNPLPNAEIKRGKKVEVVVSLGPMEIQIPSLIGTTLSKARFLIQQEELSLEEAIFVHTDTVAANHVIAQTPLADTLASKGDEVNLIVSKGPAENYYFMPDLVGRDIDSVRAFLIERGFRIGEIRFDSDPEAADGLILRQFPRPGDRISKNDLVRLVANQLDAEPESTRQNQASSSMQFHFDQ